MSEQHDEFELLREMTEKLMVHKYLYHEVENPQIKDREYEKLKYDRTILAERLGIDPQQGFERPGFDYNHPMANKAIVKAKKLIGAL